MCGPGAKLQEAGVHQLLVKNLHGKSVTMDVDLDQDVSHLAWTFIAHEGLQSALRLTLRFTFSGRRLEQGVPLWRYGLVRGSTVHAFACPGGRSSPPRKTSRLAKRCAWGESLSSRDPPTAIVQATSLRSSMKRAEALEELPDPKGLWVEFPVTITTPFAQVTGTLEYPDRYWPSCRLSPRILRKMLRITDVLGVHAPRGTCLSDCDWRLRMEGLHPFPGIQPPTFGDVWQRLQATTARVDVRMPRGGPLRNARPLVNEDDELALGAWAKGQVIGLQLSVSLLRDAEVAVDDVTVMFREADGASSRGVCSVCLEPMLAGDMCRRLACLHCLHAGCAMSFLPAMRCCPVCRSSIASSPGPASAAQEAREGTLETGPGAADASAAGPAAPGASTAGAAAASAAGFATLKAAVTEAPAVGASVAGASPARAPARATVAGGTAAEARLLGAAAAGTAAAGITKTDAGPAKMSETAAKAAEETSAEAVAAEAGAVGVATVEAPTVRAAAVDVVTPSGFGPPASTVRIHCDAVPECCD